MEPRLGGRDWRDRRLPFLISWICATNKAAQYNAINRPLFHCSSASSCQNCPTLKDSVPRTNAAGGSWTDVSIWKWTVVSLPSSPLRIQRREQRRETQQLCLPDTNKLLELNKTIKFGHLNQQILIPLKCVWLLAHCKLLIHRSAPEKGHQNVNVVFLWRALKTCLFWSMFHLKTWMMCRGGGKGRWGEGGVYLLASSSISEQLFL